MTKQLTYLSKSVLEARLEHDIAQVRKIKTAFNSSKDSAENVAHARTIIGDAVAASTSSAVSKLGKMPVIGTVAEPLIQGGVEGLRGWNATNAQTAQLLKQKPTQNRPY